MNIERWIRENTSDLSGKNIVIFGATGGIGQALCTLLPQLGGNLILTGRNPQKCRELTEKILKANPCARVETVLVDLESVQSVKACVAQLRDRTIDVLIHNAGIYHVPLKKTETGFNNVFQVNFISPYYITKKLLPGLLRSPEPRVVVSTSIAHRLSRLEERDPDFSHGKTPMRIYGNSKKYLTYSMKGLLAPQDKIHLALTHPGIADTNMLKGYPPFVTALIRYPVKLLFLAPKKACLSALQGVFDENIDGSGIIGPGVFGIWGYPRRKHLKAREQEETAAYETAQGIFRQMDAM